MSSNQCFRPNDQNCRQGSQQHHSSSFGQMLGSVFKPQGGHNHNHGHNGSTTACQTQCCSQTHQGRHVNHNPSMGKPGNSNGLGSGKGPQTNGGHLHAPHGHGQGNSHSHARGGSAACQGKTQRRRGLLRRIKDGISGDSSSDSDSESDSDNEGCRRNRC